MPLCSAISGRWRSRETLKLGGSSHLLKAIAALGLMTLPPDLEGKIYDHPSGVYKCIDGIGILSALPDIEVIHVLPEAAKGVD